MMFSAFLGCKIPQGCSEDFMPVIAAARSIDTDETAGSRLVLVAASLGTIFE
jgi:hypothetical protein